jgi:DNA-binding NarL/FixJ family response regulator
LVVYSHSGLGQAPESVPENLSYSLQKMDNGVPDFQNSSRAKPVRCEKRRNRKRPHVAWEQAALASNGFYARNLADVEKKFPKLTPMQCRVCALVKAGLPSWRIAEMLGLSERTIENHRHNAHQAIGCEAFERLEEALR